MTETDTTKKNNDNDEVEVKVVPKPSVGKEEASKATEASSTEKPAAKATPSRQNNQREFKKNRRTPRRRDGPRSEFNQKILDIRRVTRVSAGGRRFTFAVSIAIGDGKGKIGVGTGKGNDTALAIEKAVKSAKKAVIKVKTTSDMSIPHDVKAKYSSAQVLMIPSPGRGIVAGSALRDLLELGGLMDINGKIISGSKNKLNIAQAVLKAFGTLRSVKPEMKKIKKDSKPSVGKEDKVNA